MMNVIMVKIYHDQRQKFLVFQIKQQKFLVFQINSKTFTFHFSPSKPNRRYFVGCLPTVVIMQSNNNNSISMQSTATQNNQNNNENSNILSPLDLANNNINNINHFSLLQQQPQQQQQQQQKKKQTKKKQKKKTNKIKTNILDLEPQQYSDILTGAISNIKTPTVSKKYHPIPGITVGRICSERYKTKYQAINQFINATISQFSAPPLPPPIVQQQQEQRELTPSTLISDLPPPIQNYPSSHHNEQDIGAFWTQFAKQDDAQFVTTMMLYASDRVTKEIGYNIYLYIYITFFPIKIYTYTYN